MKGRHYSTPAPQPVVCFTGLMGCLNDHLHSGRFQPALGLGRHPHASGAALPDYQNLGRRSEYLRDVFRGEGMACFTPPLTLYAIRVDNYVFTVPMAIDNDFSEGVAFDFWNAHHVIFLPRKILSPLTVIMANEELSMPDSRFQKYILSVNLFECLPYEART
jgi:hypothetical protein